MIIVVYSGLKVTIQQSSKQSRSVFQDRSRSSRLLWKDLDFNIVLENKTSFSYRISPAIRQGFPLCTMTTNN